jgi:hypothetical protein
MTRRTISKPLRKVRIRWNANHAWLNSTYNATTRATGSNNFNILGAAWDVSNDHPWVHWVKLTAPYNDRQIYAHLKPSHQQYGCNWWLNHWTFKCWSTITLIAGGGYNWSADGILRITYKRNEWDSTMVRLISQLWFSTPRINDIYTLTILSSQTINLHSLNKLLPWAPQPPQNQKCSNNLIVFKHNPCPPSHPRFKRVW